MNIKKLLLGCMFSPTLFLSASTLAESPLSFDRVVQDNQDVTYIHNEMGEYLEFKHEKDTYLYVKKLKGEWIKGPVANETQSNIEYCESQGLYRVPGQKDINQLNNLLSANDPDALKIAESLGLDLQRPNNTGRLEQNDDEFWIIIRDTSNDEQGITSIYQHRENDGGKIYYSCMPGI